MENECQTNEMVSGKTNNILSSGSQFLSVHLTSYQYMLYNYKAVLTTVGNRSLIIEDDIFVLSLGADNSFSI